MKRPSNSETLLGDIEVILGHPDLTMLDRFVRLARLKDTYERFFPDSRPGGARTNSGIRPKNKRTSGFVEAAVRFSNSAPVTIERGVYIGANISPALLTALAATPISKREVDLYRIARMTSADQAELLRLLSAAAKPPDTLSAILLKLERPPAKPDYLKQLTEAWSKSTDAERETFLASLPSGGPSKASTPDNDHDLTTQQGT